ncbi:beta-1,3-galactosyltransferase 5-like [Sitophilus oryzae]|uniref:Hexosyltransferase n=1 Tax=Sitophilus oryzae TaxID=7048 RepID=A0A6J2Y595_SITOR|nr:beta-1,3-galactosyltransferase 5-like [Sitophilus oryzae]
MEIHRERNSCWRPMRAGYAKMKTVFLLILLAQLLALIYFVLTWGGTKYSNFLETPIHGTLKIHRRNSALTSSIFDTIYQYYQRLIDLNDFYFTIINPEACNAPVFLLVLVSSAANHLHHRHIIRTTWKQHRTGIKIIFVLGKIQDIILQRDIMKESDVYGDVIQGNFLDTYRNLTYKTMSAFKYMLYHCKKASYVLKIDDDDFVNMPLLLNFLKNDLSVSGTDNLFICNHLTGYRVNRNVSSKWYVSEMDLSDDFYPSYCAGWYVLLSPDVLFRLYETTQKLKYISVDDALIYGYAREKCNLVHTDFTRFTREYSELELGFNGTYDSLPLLFGGPNMSSEQIKKFWLYFRSRPVLKSLRDEEKSRTKVLSKNL